MATFSENASSKLSVLLGRPVTGKVITAEHRAVIGQVCADAKSSGMSIEQMIIALKAMFDKVPASSIDLQSVNGPIALTLPSDAKASLEATTVHGRIENEFGLKANTHMVGHDMRGKLGGGGTEIRLSNVNGPIEIYHANDGRAMSPAKSETGGDEDEI